MKGDKSKVKVKCDRANREYSGWFSSSRLMDGSRVNVWRVVESFDEEIDERLRSVKNPTECRTLAGLLRETSRLPLEQTRVVI